ncbi:hypothetical protein B0H11DRAFT_2028686 [Mycena galericulata]|nr:hypothetical protein B0H11DRAFT_2028686 [Mycena galericulata]
MVAQPGLPLMNLVTSILATLFYGMYCIIFATSMSLLFGRPGTSAKHILRSVVFVSGCALFIAITGHWIVTIIAIFQGFIYFQDGLAADIYFNDNSRMTETLTDIFLGVSVALGDGMIIYRLWVVWSYNKRVIIVPVLSLLGLIVTTSITVKTTTHVQSIASDTGLTALTVFTLVTNVHCTAFISWKIWRITRSCMPEGGTNLQHFLAIVVESAALYTAWIIYYSTCHQLNTNLQFIAVSALPSVVGIANGLIHVRIGLGRTIEQIPRVGSKPASSLSTAPMRFVLPPSDSESRVENDVGGMSRIWTVSAG